jgi:hypothetical protein
MHIIRTLHCTCKYFVKKLINILNHNFKETISHIVELRQKTTDQISF